jgi:hypothetical protein
MLASLKPESSTMKPGVFEFVIVTHAALIIDCCGAHSTSGLGQSRRRPNVTRPPWSESGLAGSICWFGSEMMLRKAAGERDRDQPYLGPLGHRRGSPWPLA